MHALAAWWSETLGWPITYDADDEVEVSPATTLDVASASVQPSRPTLSPTLTFVSVPEGKTVENRLHVDLAPGPDDDQAADVQALVDRGATRIDIGQGSDITWVVLADPEGNEF
ncbi:VOC family protein [Frondihabitans sp. PAMC 28766]|uniref:VOC family protein n=1 Tax=Frondihabitans sp. PAMC 28766 TaxID=1795630 RepID=UPI001EF701C7|nr:VOC family protein [Frondihabitans sp. PAMC 28766]